MVRGVELIYVGMIFGENIMVGPEIVQQTTEMVKMI